MSKRPYPFDDVVMYDTESEDEKNEPISPEDAFIEKQLNEVKMLNAKLLDLKKKYIDEFCNALRDAEIAKYNSIKMNQKDIFINHILDGIKDGIQMCYVPILNTIRKYDCDKLLNNMVSINIIDAKYNIEPNVSVCICNKQVCECRKQYYVITWNNSWSVMQYLDNSNYKHSPNII